MSDLDRRRKMISLRLSEVDYEVLKTRYRAFGARNVSDLARLALQRMMNGLAAPQGDVTAKLSELNERIHTLEAKMSHLLERER
jgi:hypothetical protein